MTNWITVKTGYWQTVNAGTPTWHETGTLSFDSGEVVGVGEIHDCPSPTAIIYVKSIPQIVTKGSRRSILADIITSRGD